MNGGIKHIENIGFTTVNFLYLELIFNCCSVGWTLCEEPGRGGGLREERRFHTRPFPTLHRPSVIAQ
jgi:hypothetical protein